MSDRIQKLKYSHEAVVDILLANPTLTHKEIGELVGRSAAWVSYVVNSDAFRTLLNSRRDAIIDPVLTTTVEDRLKTMVNRSLDIVVDRLNTPDCPPEFAVRAAEMGSKALGYGARPESNDQKQYVVVLPEGVRSPQDWADIHRPQTGG